MAVLEDERPTPNAAPSRAGWSARRASAISGACSATRRSRKPRPRTTRKTGSVFAASADSRSWFSAAAPPTSAPAGSAARSRSMVAPTAGSTGRRSGPPGRARAPSRPRAAAGATARSPGSRRARPARGPRRRPRETTCSVPGAPGPKASCTCVVADSRAVARRDDLDRRHAGVEPEDGHGEQEQDGERGHAVERAAGARAARPSAAKRGDRCSPAWTHGSASLSTRSPSHASTAGSSVSVASEDERDREHDPERHRAERRARHEHHRGQRDQDGHAREQHRLAGRVHRERHRVARSCVRAEVRAAERATMKSA